MGQVDVDQIFSGVTAGAAICVGYLVAFAFARARRGLDKRGSNAAGRRLHWGVRLLGSAGIVRAIVSPAAAGSGRGGPKQAGSSSSDVPWEEEASGRRPFPPDGNSQTSDRPWKTARESSEIREATESGSRAISAPPWSGDGGSSPPRPLLRTGAAADSRGSTQTEQRQTTSATDSAAEEAVPTQVLGKNRPGNLEKLPGRGEWTVQKGDTLWDIAARVLKTTDAARIARYWPAIHRANREAIGPNPNLILPGQILTLPGEEPRS
jgi:nucleoid-associated protein YgaU